MKNLVLCLLVLLSANILAQNDFVCGVPERVHKAPSLALIENTPNGLLCANVFVQIDADIVADKGLQGAEDFARDAMAQAAIPYLDKDIELSFSFEFLTSEVYADGSSIDLLYQFVDEKPSFNGDIAILLSYKSSGGVAFVNTACKDSNPYKYAFASVQPSHRPFRDGYSWNPMVISHELAHGFGSPHLQDCAWFANGQSDQALEGCYPGGGSCDQGPIPADGGQLLGYCHLNSVGINFNKGFHEQVASLIRANIYNRCTTCDSPGGDGGDPPVVECENNPLFLNTILDAWPEQTSYKLTSSTGEVLFESRAFSYDDAGKVIADTLCLPDGCYTYTITDINGLAPHPEFSCVEGYFYLGDAFGEIGSGQDFNGEITIYFCLGDTDSGDCLEFELKRDSLINYVNQSRNGRVFQLAGGVEIDGNYWQAQAEEYEITERTILEGEVYVDDIGEINGIGLVNNVSGLYPSRSWRFQGTQSWGIPIDYVSVGSWQDISIPVGQRLAGEIVSHIVLINDDDGRGEVRTAWKNFKLCESGAAGLAKTSMAAPEGEAEDENWEEGPLCTAYNFKPYPNPTADTLTLPVKTIWHLYDSSGKLIGEGWGDEVEMTFLPPGLYLLHDGITINKIIKN